MAVIRVKECLGENKRDHAALSPRASFLLVGGWDKAGPGFQPILNITPYLRAEYYFQVDEWEEARKRAKAFKGNQYIESSFVNSQNTTKELSKTLDIGQQAASRIIQIHDNYAERKLGGMLASNPDIHPGNPQLLHGATIGLSELGIERTASHRWQKLQEEALSLRYDFGWTERRIAGQLNLSKTTIDRWMPHNSNGDLPHNTQHLEGEG